MKQFRILLIAMVFLVGFSACSEDDDVQEFEITVASTQPLIAFEGNYVFYYFVKYDNSPNWEKFVYIDGFQYEEGYEYRLKIRQESVDSNGMEGGYPYKRTLLKEISKTKKNSENIPVQTLSIWIASQKTGDEDLPYYMRTEKGWEKIGPIESFAFEEGYQYNIVVDYIYVGSLGAEPYKYVCKRISDKVKVDTPDL